MVVSLPSLEYTSLLIALRNQQNIFANDDGSWCIGDFGLSKMMQDATQIGTPTNRTQSDDFVVSGGYVDDVHTAGVGTASYAAPEQITQKTYGPSVDIFALGLILLELFSNFTSEHERANAFHDCRHHGELAPWMKRTYPEVSSLVLACTQKDERRRPTASDIQAASVFQERGSGAEIFRAELRVLKGELTRKDSVIRAQRDQISEKDEMIERLTRRLAEAGIGVGTENDSARSVVDDVSSSSSEDDY